MKSINCPVGCEGTEDECPQKRRGEPCCGCLCHRKVADLPDPVTGYPSFLPPGFGKPKKKEVAE